MINSIEAVYRHGVFEPLRPVNLEEEQRVRLLVESTETEAIAAWIKRADAHREAILKSRSGEPLPDSTNAIAEDRMR